MLEYAPDSVNEDVWHRVVQVVTGNEEELHEELQQYSAQKAYSCLERYPHPTMVKLAGYLLGEFGHVISREVSSAKQFAMLHRQFTRQECAGCRAGLLCAFAKLLN